MKKLIIIALALVASGVSLQAQAACDPANVSVTIKNADGSLMNGARFVVYEQQVDANDQAQPGKQLVAGTTDKYLGVATVKVPVSSSTQPYAVMVVNPDLKNANYWFFNELYLGCGSQVAGTLVLSELRVRVFDFSDLSLLKNIKLTLYEQSADASGLQTTGKALGSFTTGANGIARILVPASSRSLDGRPAALVLEVQNSKGVKFYRYAIMAKDQNSLEIDFKLTEALVTLRDAVTGNPLPGAKLDLYERKISQFGGYTTGKQLGSAQTNDKGQAFFQYPEGDYVLQFKYGDGRVKNFDNIHLDKETRNTIDLMLEGYNKSQCSLKSNLRLSFRDAEGSILGNLSYTLYEQKLSRDGLPLADAKVVAGSVDQYGFAKSVLTPSPAKQYALEVCDKSVKNACFWFYNLNFVCNQDLPREQVLGTVKLVLRRTDKQLAVGERYKIYLRQLNVDGQSVIDKNKLVANGSLPASGQVVLRLPAKDWQGEALVYTLVVSGKNNQELMVDFQPAEAQANKLEYLIQDSSRLLPYRPAAAPAAAPVASSAAAKGLKGKILLQVEARGEAWYVNPVDGRRYFLGRPVDAFALMKRLAVGIKTAELEKIPLSLALTAGADDDGDGLPNELERALGSDSSKADTDGDSFNDYQEAAGNYNLRGAGALRLDGRFAAAQAGRILLQVDGNGEAWYVFAGNNRRYFLGRPADAFRVMRELGVGISNRDLEAIPQGQ